jgi:hypothetical protein
MGRLLQLGDILATNAYLFPDKVGARDLTRSLTFRAWNERACKLANALLGLGLGSLCISAHRDWLRHPPGDGARARAEYSSHMTQSPDPRFERLAPFSDLCRCRQRTGRRFLRFARQVPSTHKSSSLNSFVLRYYN